MTMPGDDLRNFINELTRPKFGVVKPSELPREEQRRRAPKPPLSQNLGDLLRAAGVKGRPVGAPN